MEDPQYTEKYEELIQKVENRVHFVMQEKVTSIHTDAGRENLKDDMFDAAELVIQ